MCVVELVVMCGCVCYVHFGGDFGFGCLEQRLRGREEGKTESEALVSVLWLWKT